MKKNLNFSRQIKVVNSYLAPNRDILTNFFPPKKIRHFFSFFCITDNRRPLSNSGSNQ